jgi:hypothetical protein
MSDFVSKTPFRYDSRGNRLERWETASTGSGHALRLRGPVEVAGQVQAIAPEYRITSVSVGTASGWTHELASPERTLRHEVRQLLELLCEVVSLPNSPPIKFAIVLDWYKIPVDAMEPRDWPNTVVGDLVSRGKYLYKTQEGPKSKVGRNLAGRICNAIERHAALKGVEAILNVPGHDSKFISFGPRLAATVAKYERLPLLRVSARSEFRPESKSLRTGEHAAVLDNEFIVPPEIRGRSALIVDDVYRTGESMTAVAKVAYEAGAREVFGICAARTRKR